MNELQKYSASVAAAALGSAFKADEANRVAAFA